MSNMTIASGEPSPSISSDNYTSPAKRKRNLPGNPDPDAEVIALSPESLMATNRFVCQVCNKGFQRDQNLQLHRRGHNLPWKLRQRSGKESIKRVYICPETSCVHHNPSRALGDLTGIKKHFSRKHGEKKWKCEKCSKTYAVQSDWKAHSKTCGTREYRCDCGTLFSRRDSFITHRAFCDALAQDKAIMKSSACSSPPPSPLATMSVDDQTVRPPLWLAASIAATNPMDMPNINASSFLVNAPHPPPKPMLNIPPSNCSDTGVQNPSLAGLWAPLASSSTMGSVYSSQNAMDLSDGIVGGATNWSSISAVLAGMDMSRSLPSCMYGDLHDNGNERPITSSATNCHMSATALLQKAAQMGAKPGTGSSSTTSSLYSASMEREKIISSFVHESPMVDTEKANAGLQDMMKSFVGSFNAENSLDGVNKIATAYHGHGLMESSNIAADLPQHSRRVLQVENQNNGKASGEDQCEGITRDFLGVGMRVVLNMGAYKNLLE